MIPCSELNLTPDGSLRYKTDCLAKWEAGENPARHPHCKRGEPGHRSHWDLKVLGRQPWFYETQVRRPARRPHQLESASGLEDR